tara:strand:- start:3983 stop:4489 length:507 start_codon:yes stop_codon:yes gene_type:complete
MSDQTKYEVVSRILNKMEPKDISAELDMSYGKVLRIKREYEDAVKAGTVSAFIDIDAVVLDQALAVVAADTPEGLLPEVDGAIKELKQTKSATDKLSEELLLTAGHLNTRIRSLALSIEHVSELEGLTGALCQLQVAFFNSNSTQVNVQNNFGDAGATKSTYGEFLSD